MQFLMAVARLGSQPSSSTPRLAQKTKRADDASPSSAPSFTVSPERSATKEETLKIIGELNGRAQAF